MLSQLLKDIFDNFPEYCADSPYECIEWKYDKEIFTFRDTEEGKVYTIPMGFSHEQCNEALKECIKYLSFNEGLNGPNMGNQWTKKQLQDPCNWDSGMAQTLLDFIFYKEARYS